MQDVDRHLDAVTGRPEQSAPAPRPWAGLRVRYPNAVAVGAVWCAVPIVLLVGVMLGVSISSQQLYTILFLGSFAVIVAFGQHLAILTGGLDLSLPNSITLSSVLLAGLAGSSNVRALWAVPAVLLVAAGVGALNGVGIAVLRISPVIMTLSANVILFGVIQIYTDGTPSGNAPSALSTFVQWRWGGFRLLVLFTAVFALGATLLLHRTVFGRHLFAVGNNQQVARLSGVPVRRTIVLVYALSGFTFGLAGVVLTGNARQGAFGLGDPYLFLSIAAVVVGGTSIMGGRGNYLGTVGGAVLFTAMGTVLAGTVIPQSLRSVIFGLVLLVAVIAVQRGSATRSRSWRRSRRVPSPSATPR